jgi:selenide,water dikinase
MLDDAGYRAMIDTTTQLNLPGTALAQLPGVHAMTDVTGFGLLGHLLEMCRGSGLGARITAAGVPLLPGVQALAQAGIMTGASARNWQSYGESVRIAAALDAAVRTLLTDPQTSGGLLVACDRDAVSSVEDTFNQMGFSHASVIGRMFDGDAHVWVE